MTSDHLDAAIIPWIERTDAITRDRMSDARAHAKVGDLATATRRLTSLHHGLIGPHGEGVIGDARAAFYRDVHDAFDPEIHDPSRRFPVPEESQVIRQTPINGRDAHRDLAGLIDQSRQGLTIAATSMGMMADAGSWTAIDTWHAQHSATIQSWARRTLSDNQMAIASAVGHLRIKPELR